MYRDDSGKKHTDGGWQFFDGTEKDYTVFYRNKGAKLVKIPDFDTEELASNIIAGSCRRVKYISHTEPIENSPD